MIAVSIITVGTGKRNNLSRRKIDDIEIAVFMPYVKGPIISLTEKEPLAIRRYAREQGALTS